MLQAGLRRARSPLHTPPRREARDETEPRENARDRREKETPKPVERDRLPPAPLALDRPPAPLVLDRQHDYSDAAMIAEIRRVAALVQTPPYRAAFFLARGAFKFSHLYRRFGSWAGALERAGLAHLAAPPRRWAWRERRHGWALSDDALLDELRRVAGLAHGVKNGGPDGNGKTLHERDLRRLGRYQSPTYAKRFGSWHAAARLAGLTPAWSNRAHSAAECMENLRRVWTHLGRAPRVHEMDRPPSTVRAPAYQRRWGSWSKALHAFAARVNADPDDKLRLSLAARSIPPAPPVPREERHAVPVALRHAILTRDRFRCVLCGASPATDPRTALQLDHITPFSQGGRSVPENLRTLCAECNQGRGPHAYLSGSRKTAP